MPDATQTPAVRRFGTFEINLHSGELRKNGMRLRLSGQPFQVLAVLVERAGDVVTREELHSKLWPADTFVDFDHGLNNTVARIREVLDDSSDSPRYVQTIPRRGYRFIAPLTNVHSARIAGSAADSTIAASQTMLGPAASGRRPVSERRLVFTRPMAWLVGAVVIAVLVVSFVSYRASVRSAGQSAVKSLAVLPLKNLSGDPTQEYFADGMTEALITELGKISALQVISHQSVLAYRQTAEPLPQIARELKVNALLEGTALRSGSKVRITVNVLQAVPERHLWAESYELDQRDVLTVQGEVARGVAGQIRVRLMPQEQARLSNSRPVDPEAYEAYLLGRAYFYKMATPANWIKAK